MTHDAIALTALLTAGRGLTTTRRLHDFGLTDRDIERCVANKVLARVRRGVFADFATFSQLDSRERHVLRFRAEALSMRSAPVASHLTAAALHGPPIIDGWPDAVHVADFGARGGSGWPGRVTHRAGEEVEPVDIDGMLATPLSRTVVDLARILPFASALAVVDAALRGDRGNSARGVLAGAAPPRRPVSRAELLAELATSSRRLGTQRALRAVEAGDPLAESAGESLSRGRMIELGFVIPQLQVRFGDIEGGSAIVDFYWEGLRAIGEFDGMVKYSRSLELEGRTAADVVVREKRREDALRRRVAAFHRWTWADAIAAPKFARLLAEFGIPLR
ncbi:hypothetical protein [Ruicaihuangia caeni]|uniref:hypothetical protein n=1 Tax=Ruicaihuangia caeni TaxID=3042517 RepID=UPI00338EED34